MSRSSLSNAYYLWPHVGCLCHTCPSRVVYGHMSDVLVILIQVVLSMTIYHMSLSYLSKSCCLWSYIGCVGHTCPIHVAYSYMSDISIILVQDVLFMVACPFQTPFTCFHLRLPSTISCWVNMECITGY